MPKPATDRLLLTTTKPATDVLEEQLQSVRQAVTEHGAVWHVRVLDWRQRDNEDTERPYIAVDFQVVQHDDDQLDVAKWSISGYEVLATRQSRFPLKTYARAALLAVEDALAADDLTHEEITAQELTYIGSLADDAPRRWVSREFRIVDGKIEDPRTGRPRTPARRKHDYPKAGKHQLELSLVVDEYRRAIERGSNSPTVDVARAFNVGRSTAARSLAEARRQGLLGPALRNRAGEQT